MWRELGAPAQMRTQIERAQIDVYPENADALRYFGLMATQWRSAGMGGREGLIYAELWALMTEHGITRKARRQALFADIRVMEAEALNVWREQAERQRST